MAILCNISAWTDIIGEWGRLPMPYFVTCVWPLEPTWWEKKTNSFMCSSDHHVHHASSQNKQIYIKKDEQFCCCMLLGIKPRVLYMLCQVLITPFSFDLFLKNLFKFLLIERSTLLLMWKTGCTVIEWHMTSQTVRHRTSLEWLSRQLVERVGSKRINCL